MLVVRIEKTRYINHFVSGCSVQRAIYRLARSASIVFYLLRLLYIFFLLVAQVYFCNFVNWLAGYHLRKTLEVSPVVPPPTPLYGSKALVDLDLLPLLGSSSTLDRTSLDEWSARRRDLCLTTHNIHTSMTPAEFETLIPTSERP